MPSDETDLRLLRLIDLDPHDVIQVRCPGCGWVVEYGYGALQRHHHLPSTMLVFDLQFRYRCKQCRCTDGFRITVWDGRARGTPSADRHELMIVAGDAPRYQRADSNPSEAGHVTGGLFMGLEGYYRLTGAHRSKSL